uniref:Uncharacterized protein n=1 Tax=Haemonchus contortus TaxID=6289 RepID=A0A7I4YLH6_HAECO
MAICASKARTLASEACVEDLTMRTKKIKYDPSGLIETKRHRSLYSKLEMNGSLEHATVDASAAKQNPKNSINWDHFAFLARDWEGSVIYNIDEEYNRLAKHLHGSPRKAESLQVAERQLFSETLELIGQRGTTRAAGNCQQTSKLAKLCREAIKDDLKEKRAVLMDEATKPERSIRSARRSFANYETKMTSLHRPDGTVTAPRREMEMVIYYFFSDLSASHVLPTILDETDISILRFFLP